MAYVCELGNGHAIYLDNVGNQTTVTSVISRPGQQQQSSSSITTGEWTHPPAAAQTPLGVVIHVATATGEQSILVQGSQIEIVTADATPHAQPIPLRQTQQSAQSHQGMRPMEPLPPLESMKPMTMGNMSMSMNPMEMRMGNMELKLDQPSTHPSKTRFCSQCGAQVDEGDRFCSSCGHALK